MEVRFYNQLIDQLPAILFWQGDERIAAGRSAVPGLGDDAYASYAPLNPPLRLDYQR